MTGFSEWLKHHCTVFGLNDPRYVEMVASWQPLFDAAGYTAAQLVAVTDWLAIHSPPRFPGEHLGAIRQRMLAIMAIQAKDAEDKETSVCTLCGNTGRLVVPHVKCIQDEQWRHLATVGAMPFRYTMAVRCRCFKGRMSNFDAREGKEDKDRLLTLEQYEMKNPNWPEQMDARREEYKAEAQVMTVDQAKQQVGEMPDWY